MALTRIMACMADDVLCLYVVEMDKMTSACHPQGISARDSVHRRVVVRQKSWRCVKARDWSGGGQNLRFCRSVDEKANREAYVSNEDLRVRIPMQQMGDFSEPTAARGKASGDQISGFSS